MDRWVWDNLRLNNYIWFYIKLNFIAIPTQILQVHSYLMHATGERLAQHHASVTILGQLLEGCGAILALLRYLANANLVADHLNGFLTLHDTAIIRRNLILKIENMINIWITLTLGKRPRHDRYTPCPPACFGSAVPFDAPSSDFARRARDPRWVDRGDESCVDSSDWTPWQV